MVIRSSYLHNGISYNGKTFGYMIYIFILDQPAGSQGYFDNDDYNRTCCLCDH